MGSLPASTIPVIDFTKASLKPGTDLWVSTSKEVLDALQEHGCFLAEYDKVPLDLHNDVFSVLEEVFDLPLETKRKNVSDLPYYGYVGNQPFIPDLYEGLGINNAVTLEGTQDFTATMWPDGNDRFCEKVFSFSKLIAELEQTVMRMLFESYGLDSYETHQKDVTTYLFRMMRYKAANKDEDKLGCDIHTDKGFLTLLHQNHVNGLEVKSKDGHWMGIKPSPSSFIVMAGDALMGWSNGRISSPFHRVMMEEGEARYSVALFSYVKGTIEVPAKLIDEDHPLKFRPFDNFGLLHYFFTPEGRAQESTITAYCGI